MVFVDDSVGHGALFLHDIGIIGAGNEQNLLDLEGHEFMKDLEMRIVVFNVQRRSRHSQQPKERFGGRAFSLCKGC
jgi:hypothetical protein